MINLELLPRLLPLLKDHHLKDHLTVREVVLTHLQGPLNEEDTTHLLPEELILHAEMVDVTEDHHLVTEDHHLVIEDPHLVEITHVIDHHVEILEEETTTEVVTVVTEALQDVIFNVLNQTPENVPFILETCLMISDVMKFESYVKNMVKFIL